MDPEEPSGIPEVVSELTLSLNEAARGTRSPGFYGYSGPEFDAWMEEVAAQPHHQILRRKTYELLNDLPEEAKDDASQRMAATPGWLFSRSLKTVEWPGLEVVADDMLGHVRRLKAADGPELRVSGSLSVVRQLQEAGFLDRLRVILCPLVLPQTGTEPAFAGWPDTGFDLLDTRVLDGRVLVLDYRPVGEPPRGE